jgi:hypothetical protein
MGHGLAVPIVSAVLVTAVARDGASLGTPAAYLLGYQQAVLLMAALCVGGVVATIAGSLSRPGWELRAAADRAPAPAEPRAEGVAARSSAR